MKRALLPLMTGLWGGATMLAMSGFFSLDLAGPAAVGAALAGIATARLFGRPNAVWAVVAAVLATTLGAAMVGAYVGYPGDVGAGMVAAPVMVWAAIVQDPVVLMIWLAGAYACRGVAWYLAAVA